MPRSAAVQDRPGRSITRLFAVVSALAVSALASAGAPAATVRGPDLVISAVSNPAKPVAGKLAVRAKVRNAGDRKARASAAGVYLSSDAKLDGRDRRLGRVTVRALAPKKKVALAPTLTVAATTPAGAYHLLVCADDRKRIRERNERNNCRASRMRVAIAASPITGPVVVPTVVPTAVATVIPTVGPTATAGPTETPTATATSTATASPTASPTATATATPPGGGSSDPPAADPVAAATSVDLFTAGTSFSDATSFLYSGGDPIQEDVTPGAIKPDQVAVARGRVLNRMGGGVAGVRITVLDHPELGRTATRTDGRFDLALNGGGLFTLRFERSGWITVQRQVDVPWQDYVALDDIVLIPYDTVATDIDLGSPTEIQVARANEVTDSDGSRQATLLFSPGTDAQLVLPDGSTTAIDDLHVRATEYTIGATGEAAMPGDLPANTAYTYAAEFSVDEAVEAGATEVRFDEPVATYIENFLDMDVGNSVPAGYYDRELGLWVPMRNGRVIKIVGESGGQAELDTDGDGSADDSGDLAIPAAERTKLAALYDTGDELWRVAVTHFSPVDYNFPYNPPADAVSPQQPPPIENRPKPKKKCFGDGSVIACQTQALGETVGVAGTPFSLNYWSDRTPAREDDRTLIIPLSGPSIPGSLEAILLQISIAGRTISESHPPSANLKRVFAWDGRDAYGRLLQGDQRVNVRIGYKYTTVKYSGVPRPIAGTDTGVAAAFFGRPNFLDASSREQRQPLIVWQEYSDTAEGAIGNWDARGQALGGWTLSAHHTYDSARKTVHLGDGDQINVEPVITTAGGTGTPPAFAGQGDGGQATAANLGYANDVEVAPDGSVYVSEIYGNNAGRIRRIRRDGIIETVAGGGFSHADNIPATQSALNGLRGIALGPDGSLYLNELNGGIDGYVKRIDPQGIIHIVAGGGQSFASGIPATQAFMGVTTDIAVGPDGGVYVGQGGWVRHIGLAGIITTVAGGGSPPDGVGDGGAATAAALGHVDGVAVSPNGDLYIGGSDTEGRVRRVDTSGRISTVAGGGTPAGSDGGPGTEAKLGSLYGMNFGRDGSLYFTERAGANYVRRLAPDGTIYTVAGHDSGGLGDRGPATRGVLGEITGVDTSPDGSFYIATHGAVNFSGRVRRVSRPQPKSSGGTGLIPSSDGAQAFEFDSGGRHLRTRGGLTGATLLTFGYDGAGRLVTLTDADGSVTTIERAAGVPTAIVAPGGQRTELTVNADGWLGQIAKPANGVTSMIYTPAGLMTDLTDPRGGLHHFEHDTGGRLILDEDPDGGSQTFARTAYDDGYKVTRTTALGRVSTFSVRRAAAGGLLLDTVDPSGGTTAVQSRPDGTQTAIFPDGTQVDTETGPDPRWDYAVPSVTSLKAKTPAGLTDNTTQTSTASLSSLLDPFSVQTLTRTVVTNGRTTTSTYDGATRKLTTTSPAGRQRTTTVDARGRVTNVAPGTGLDPLVYGYDANGLTNTVAQGPSSWTFERDPQRRISARTDAEAGRTEFTYDGADRVATMTAPSDRVYTFGYDASGNRTGVMMPDGDQHTLGYSPGDRLDLFKPAGSVPSLTRSYNDDHQLDLVTLPGGRVVDRGYDAGGRLTTLDYPERATALSYVGNTQRPATITATPAGGGTAEGLAFTYDGDLPTTVSQSGTAAGIWEYTYDTSSRLSNVKLTSGAPPAVDSPITRDNDGLATGFGPFTFGRTGPGGAVNQIGDGTLVHALGHDGRARVTTKTQTVAGQTVYSSSLTRDDAGRITQKVETIGGVASTLDYTYDLDGRLTNVDRDAAAAERYTYDSNGNRTTRTLGASPAETYAYDGQERLDSHGLVDYGFDADGYMSSRGADTFSYTARGELRTATVGATTVNYAYDGFGRRVARTQGADTTRYLYGNLADPLEVTAVREPSGVLTHYFYDELGLLYAAQRGAARFYIATDAVGTPRVVTDTTGAVVRAIGSDSFGNVTSDTAPSFDLPFGFAGGIRDAVTGLVHFGFRDYDPQSGRFTARDPLIFDGGQANLYEYAGSDPVGNRDPTGLFCIGGSVYGGVGGGASLCIDDEGFSLCAEAGFGAGTEAEIDLTGEVAESGKSIIAEAKFKAGPLEAGIEFELDDSGCLSGGPKASLGPVEVTPDDIKIKPGLEVETALGDSLVKSTKGLGLQAKIAAKVCGAMKF